MGSSVELLDATQSRVGVQSENKFCRQCLHLEDSLKAARNRSAALELEIEGKKNEVNLLQKLLALEGEKIAVENELQLLKRKSKTTGGIVDLTEEIKGEDEVVRLMTENKALECEKRKAETDIEVWKGKCKEMQLLITELEKKFVSKDGNKNGEKDVERIRKHIRFVEEGQLINKKIAPSTPKWAMV